jgi:hypothetical protein
MSVTPNKKWLTGPLGILKKFVYGGHLQRFQLSSSQLIYCVKWLDEEGIRAELGINCVEILVQIPWGNLESFIRFFTGKKFRMLWSEKIFFIMKN